jgi:integrase
LAGLRLGEAAALQFDDVDFDGGLLQVQRQVQRAGGKTVEIRLPKYGSERAVPMPEELAAILRRHEDLGHLNGWMFAGSEPDPPHQNTVGARGRATLKRAGLDGIRLHDLRHFYASGLIADGCDVVTVQRALGHTPRPAPPWTPTPSSGPPGRTAPGRPPRASPGRCSEKMRARCGQESLECPATRASTR